MPTVYTDIPGITGLQNEIMIFVKDWIKTEKTIIPQKEIFKRFVTPELPEFTVRSAINTLMREKFLRRSVVISNRSFYTMMRTA